MDMENARKGASDCNCLNLRRASQSITNIYDKALAPSGLRISQYSLLRNIDRLGPVSVSSLALEISLDRTTLVRNLKPLEEKGFIFDTSKKGTRDRQLVLTDAGRKALKEAIPLWQGAQRSMEQFLGKDGLNTLTSLLEKIQGMGE